MWQTMGVAAIPILTYEAGGWVFTQKEEHKIQTDTFSGNRYNHPGIIYRHTK